MQCSPMWTPSISSATRSSASRAVDRQVLSCAAVFATNRRLTALLRSDRVTALRGLDLLRDVEPGAAGA